MPTNAPIIQPGAPGENSKILDPSKHQILQELVMFKQM
jgi:hypothetical protein